jgi:GT2 family glycosyltransferase
MNQPSALTGDTDGSGLHPGRTTVIVVAFRTAQLALDWIPHDARVVIVHNDDVLDVAAVAHPGAMHVYSGANIGFGAGVNRGLEHVSTERVLLVNPDTELAPGHWYALTTAAPNEVVTIPLVDQHGRFGGSANQYPTPFTLACTAWNLGRVLGRDGRVRRVVAAVSRKAGGGSLAIGVHQGPGSWPLAQRWPSAAVVCLPTDAVRNVGGFDERFFLYAEDIDLAARMAAENPALVLRVADINAGFHAVGGTSRGDGPGTRAARRHELRSLHRYGADRSGVGWKLCAWSIALRLRLTGRRSIHDTARHTARQTPCRPACNAVRNRVRNTST